MVFEVRDLWPEAAIAVGALRNPVMIAAARWLESFAYRNSASIVALVERLKDGVVRRGYPAANVYVIPNGCDLDLFAVDADERQAFRLERPWLQDRFLIVYASTIGRVNVVEYLARLAASTAKRDPDVRFLVVGDGVERDHVQEVAKQLEVLDRSFFMEARVPKKAMPQLLAAADLAISLVADRKELTGDSANKVFDAFAAGRPVAINRGGSLADLLRPTGAGFVLDAGDPNAAAHALVSAIRDRVWYTRARAEARRLAEGPFSRERQAQELDRILLSAVERSSRKDRQVAAGSSRTG